MPSPPWSKFSAWIVTAVLPTVTLRYGVCADGLGAGLGAGAGVGFEIVEPEPARLMLPALLPAVTVTLATPPLLTLDSGPGTTRTEYVPAERRENLYAPFEPVVNTCSLVSSRPFLLLSM